MKTRTHLPAKMTAQDHASLNTYIWGCPHCGESYRKLTKNPAGPFICEACESRGHTVSLMLLWRDSYNCRMEEYVDAESLDYFKPLTRIRL